ncbi:MAG: sterol desaturase family protein [Myxococcaceae bacterium]|nr:sterol desaturase family protein [Myxococcaceae bacterium]
MIALAQRLLAAWVGQTLVYFTVVTLVFALVWKALAGRLKHRRVHAGDRFSRAQVWFEVRHATLTLLLGALTAVGVFALYDAGLTRLHQTSTVSSLALQLLGLIVFNDAWFYFWHRWLHRPLPFKWIHSVHHRSIDVNPFTSYSFHALEGFVLSAWVIPAVLLVPIDLRVFSVVQVVGIANNIVSHLGYELYPDWFLRTRPFSWLSSATVHSNHHTRFHGNYALFFRFWDLWLGTALPLERDAPTKASAAARAIAQRPSAPSLSTPTS